MKGTLSLRGYRSPGSSQSSLEKQGHEEDRDLKKMRVFIVVSTFHPILGGAERQALEQGRSLRQRGLEATIVTFRHQRSWAAHDTLDGVPIIRVAGPLLGSRDKLPRILQKLLY